MELVNSKAIQYTDTYSSPEDELLSRVANATNSHPHAHMLSGHVQGQFLQMISCLIRPRRILEIGTFTGYSALCLAKGLTDGGQLHTIELREEDANTALTNFSNSEYKDAILLHRGNALDIIPTLHEEWDLIFIDADKAGYIRYYELTLPRLKRNGVIIADNVLFHGEVLNENITGKNAKAIHAFNQHIADDSRVEQVLITMRDGLSMIRKL
jgi:caffeoyl-CoA O-methyltransferase